MKGMCFLALLQIEQAKVTQNHLVAYYELMTNHGDEKNASKIIDLLEKMRNHTYTISFTGHFSAGKSSMINALLDTNILPKSPIPTSGNIVEITSGEGFARVFFTDGTSVIYEEPYDIEVVQEFCKDNQSVQKVALNTLENILPQSCMIVDTPGIDAADDADRLMTESSLHLVDQLFYIMDYNHVQSEVNLHFLKQIQAQQIPFYVIINQVDKHNEAEISFKDFTNSIEQTFNQWDVNPHKIFYSSLIDHDHTYNQFQQIEDYLFGLLSESKDIDETISQSVKKIIDDHKQYLQSSYNENVPDLSSLNNEEVDMTTYDLAKEEVTILKELPAKCKRIFQDDLNQTLKNAYLMPATLREHAAHFLESQQKNFKVGLFGSRKKTDEEKAARLKNFLQPLQKNIEATIQWNFRDKVIALLTAYDLDHPDLIQFTQQLSIEYAAEDLIGAIKHGAQINGEYVLNYTNDVSVNIKNKYKATVWSLWDKIEAQIMKNTEQTIIDSEKRLAQLDDVLVTKQQQTDLQMKLEEKYDRLDDILNDPAPELSTQSFIEDLIQAKYQSIKKAEPFFPKNEEIVANQTDNEIKQPKSQQRHSIHQMTEAVDQTIQAIYDLPVFQTLLTDLKMKREKLTNRTLTVALFGAFSAGKSSFANALLGEGLLPSSPNPTTAVINQISPITKEYGHGDVVIQIKDEQELCNDLVAITKELSPPSSDLNGLIDWIAKERVFENEALDEMYQAYLHAMSIGYQSIYPYFGKTITIQLADFEKYITDETKACFIEVVTLYYDCPLTRLGITLVDTPGADSVNARHTSVAFDYIKQADALLYVTYYNHALSRADRDFLMQLGRVKEAFQLDKMFFIINAADLAESESDLQLVMDYVKKQLLQLGIRHPRIFPVSSKQALERKLNDQSLDEQMKVFENKFYKFIQEDLAALSIQSILWDIQRVYQDMTNYLNTAHLNEREKDQYQNELEQTKIQLKYAINEANAHPYEERITQRIDRQLHYVQERIAIRFHDLFKDSFNPTTITHTGRKAMKQLEKNVRHLIDDTGYELLQELRAVSLRIESFLKDLTEEVYKDLQTRTYEIDEKFNLPMVHVDELTTPIYDQAFSNIDVQPFNKALNQFKGTKAFFERNGKDLMRDELFKTVTPAIKQYMIDNKKMMNEVYMDQWHKLFERNKQQINANIEAYIENNLLMITHTNDISVLEDKRQFIASIIDEHTKEE